MEYPGELSAVMYVAERPSVMFAAGQGSWLTAEDGRRFLDFVQGWAVNSLGHAPPAIADAVAAQARTLISASPAYFNRPMVELAKSLAGLSGMERVFFAGSGAEANEGAIKLARKWGALHRNGAWRIVTANNGFHGRTLACMSASDKPGWSSLFEPKMAGFVKVPLNDIDAMAAALGDDVTAVMLEPIQGEAGVLPAEFDYLRALRALTQERGVLLILDEIQTGIGRTGTLFAYQQAGITPDILTLGKGLGGGVPLAALLATAAVSCFEPGDQGGTFSGNPLTCAAGPAVLEAVTAPGFLAQVRDRGAYLAERLRQLSARHGLGRVRGGGLLLALELPAGDAAAIAARAFEAGLLINAPRPHTLRFMPALNVSRDDIDTLIERLESVLAGGKTPATARG